MKELADWKGLPVCSAMDEHRHILRYTIMKFYNPRAKEDPKCLGWGVGGDVSHKGSKTRMTWVCSTATPEARKQQSKFKTLKFWGKIISNLEFYIKSNCQSRVRAEIKYFLSDTEVLMSFTLHIFFLSKTQKSVFY